MDFKITSAAPDMIRVEAVYMVDSWDALYDLMSEIDTARIAVIEEGHQ